MRRPVGARYSGKVRRYAAVVLVLASAGWELRADPKPDRRDFERRPRVVLYEDTDFRGGSITMEPGERIENLSHRFFSNGHNANDRVSSIRVEGEAEVTIFVDVGFRGEPLRIARDVRDLRVFERRGGGRWNDVISSVRVEGLRHDRPHGPSRDDGRDIDGAVRRAYRDILQREPDEIGFRSYREQMIENGWSEDRLRDALRGSDEYRTVVDRIVTKAYRDVLGRDPDESGRRSYSDAMLRQGWTESDVRDALRHSEEFRQHHH